MKRRQRRQVLDINGEQSDPPRRRWQNKYERVASDSGGPNEGMSNPLADLCEQYNSDSEPEDSKAGKKLDDKVNDFLKEIQLIAPEIPTVETSTTEIPANSKESAELHARATEPSSLWQECFDDSTGYPYYWHVETNQVTWEVPEELRLFRERNQQDSLNRTSFNSQWANFSSNTYPQPQINIPEGMIPKEVVARNRNRQVSAQHNSLKKSDTDASSSKGSVSKDDELDDGKIEMITSFGSDGSDSETSDNDSPVKKPSERVEWPRPQPKSRTRNREIESQSSKNGHSTTKKLDVNERPGEIGPSLPAGILPLIHGPENSTNNDSETETRRRKEDDRSREHSPKVSLKSKGFSENPSVISLGSSKSSGQSRKKSDESDSASSGKEIKFSLVPGYADDSDAEDDSASPKKLNPEPLFPIADYTPVNSATTIYTQDGTVKKVETKFTETGSIRIFQYQTVSPEAADNINDEIKQMNDELESDVMENASLEETRVVRIEEEPPKPNIFLENLESQPKAFQRKRRIAFDVIPNKRLPEPETTTKTESAPSPPSNAANETDKESQNAEIDNANDQIDEKSNSPEKPMNNNNNENGSSDNSKNVINVVKGDTSVQKAEEMTVKVKSEEEISELKKITETIMEKLKFLSEGGQPASAVQIMAIQLQTLLSAWEARALNENYLENWLTGTGRELERLEEAAAPPGWDCQWDRSHKRYFYRNLTTGDAQWTYPESDVIGGTEEMELCTTPPPQGHEESCIIESQTEKIQESTLMEKDRSSEKITDPTSVLKNGSIELTVPPPPQISSPSPPPPPRIYAEDMMNGTKKRRGSTQESVPESKRDKSGSEGYGKDAKKAKETVNPPLPPSPTKSAQPPLPPHPPIVPNPPSTEPLPPGVDPPEMPFAINAPALETTMLYTPTGPQTNPIYAATIGDPTTILGHHTALMQSQLMHYPTYHHLHNQALLAAANRLTGQEAVQFMVDYSQVYANTQIIAKPPMKTHKESLGSAIDSFYSDIASIEKTRNEHEAEQILPVETVSTPPIPHQITHEPPILTDTVLKERKKKKTKLGISKKQKEVSSMVAKWQKAQHYADND